MYEEEVTIVKLLEKYSFNPYGCMDCRELLEATYLHCKKQDPKFSYQVMSEAMALSSGNNIHKMITGVRKIGVRLGYQIAESITDDRKAQKYIRLLIDLKKSKSSEQREEILSEILSMKRRYGSRDFTKEQQELHSEWYHYIVLELLTIPDIDQSPKHLAALLRPKIRPAQVEKSIRVLLELGLVEYNIKTARLECNQNTVKTSAETKGLLIARYHQQILDLTRRSIAGVPQDKRDITTSSFKVSDESLKKLKKKIYDFHMEILAEEAEAEEATQIYQLNLQFFPVTAELGDEGQVEEVEKSA